MFRDWFARFDAELWDQQIEADAKSGKVTDCNKIDQFWIGSHADYDSLVK